MKRNKNKISGFTLIELLVVLAILSLMASMGMIAYQQARVKSRNIKRLSDMTQLNTSLEMFFANYRGYPSGSNGVPGSIVPDFAASQPVAPGPEDDACLHLTHGPTCIASDPACANIPANTYYYVPEGTPYIGTGGGTVYPTYSYYFCLGAKTGDFSAGERVLTPTGVR